MNKYGRVTTELKNLPEDEPLFILRAKDVLAPMAIEMYANLLLAASAGAVEAPYGEDEELEKLARDAQNVAAQMLVWQAEHQTVVRLPD